MPHKLKLALDANDASLEAQRSLVQNQQTEVVRINALYDTELARLKKLWAGAMPGTVGPAPAPAAATRDRRPLPSPAGRPRHRSRLAAAPLPSLIPAQPSARVALQPPSLARSSAFSCAGLALPLVAFIA